MSTKEPRSNSDILNQCAIMRLKSPLEWTLKDNNMSQTRIIKPVFPAKYLLAIMLIAASSASSAAESIDQLATRIGMDHFREAIKKGDRNAFKTLPARGYKNGLTGLLLKTNTYVNPEYSLLIAIQTALLPRCKNTKHFPVAVSL